MRPQARAVRAEVPCQVVMQALLPSASACTQNRGFRCAPHGRARAERSLGCAQMFRAMPKLLHELENLPALVRAPVELSSARAR
jgi:hypothetical protein